MKKLFLLTILWSIFASGNMYAQKASHTSGKPQANASTTKDTLLPYQKDPNLPAFNVRLLDSVTIFNTYNIPTGKPIILACFMPECEHCIKTFKAILNQMDSIQNVQFYFVTPYKRMKEIKKFYADLYMDRFPNIKVIGRDYEFFYHDFYGVKRVPDMALYDKNKKLVRYFEGETSVSEIYKYSSKL